MHHITSCHTISHHIASHRIPSPTLYRTSASFGTGKQNNNANDLYIPPYGLLKRSVSSLRSRADTQEHLPPAKFAPQPASTTAGAGAEEKSMNEICVTKLDSETNVITQFRRNSLTDQGPATPVRAEKKDEIPIVSTVRTLQQYCAVL